MTWSEVVQAHIKDEKNCLNKKKKTVIWINGKPIVGTIVKKNLTK